MTKYVNRSSEDKNAFVGLLNDPERNVIVTLLTAGEDADKLPIPQVVEIGTEIYDRFRREAATANQISSENDSHRYSILDSKNRLAGTLYISRPQSAEKEIYCVCYPPRGADSVEAMRRVSVLRAKLAGKDPNDPMPF